MRQLLLGACILAAAPTGLGSSRADPNGTGASGPEFQVSSVFEPRYSYSYRFGPAADMATSGDFLVVWATSGAGGLGEMAARSFDASGLPRGGDFSIGVGNLFHYFPESPDVSAGGGQFVAVFSSYDGTYGSGYQVKGQRFNLEGQLQGPRIDVSYLGYNAEADAAQADDFIVVWDISRVRVSRRSFSSTGEPDGPEQWFAASPVAPPDPDVALDALGNFTVIWSQVELSGAKGIQGKRFDSSGTPLGETFQVSAFASGSQKEPAIASLPDCGFVAVWSSSGQDGSFTGVFGRIFDASAQPLGGEFQVNTTTAGYQQEPDVSADDRGNFLVAWESSTSVHHGDLVRARWFDRQGQPLGGEFQVNQSFGTGQQLPTVAMRDDGESLVTWFSTESNTGPANSVRARRFCPIPGVSPPEDLIVCAGSSATFSATAAGRQPFSYQWIKDGTPLQDGGRISGATSPTLVISGAQASDAGSYACHVIDACADPQATASAAAQLAIEPAPSEVMGLTVQAENGGAALRLTWGAAAGASDYVVRSDVAPNGGFTLVVGYASDPATGLSVPMPADTVFFLVAARNPVCGEGPLR